MSVFVSVLFHGNPVGWEALGHILELLFVEWLKYFPLGFHAGLVRLFVVRVVFDMAQTSTVTKEILNTLQSEKADLYDNVLTNLSLALLSEKMYSVSSAD